MATQGNTRTRRNAAADAEAAAQADAAVEDALEDSALETDSPAGDAPEMSDEDREIAELTAAIKAASDRLTAATEAKAARVRAEAMVGITEILTEALAASQSGDAETAQTRSLAAVQALRDNAQALGLVVTVQRGSNRRQSSGNGSGGTGRSTASGEALRAEIMAVIESDPTHEWTPGEIAPEVSPAGNGNTRSTGLVFNHLVALAEAGRVTHRTNPHSFQLNSAPTAATVPSVLSGVTS